MSDDNDLRRAMEQLKLPMERLTAFVEYQMCFVDNCLRDKPHDSWIPMLFVLSVERPGGEEQLAICGLAGDFNEAQDKHIVMTRMGQMFYKDRRIPLMVALTTEAWIATEKPGDKHVQPRDNPNRQEAIVAFGATIASQRLAHTHMIITRDAQDRIVPGTVGEIQTSENMAELRSPLLDYFWRGYIGKVMAMRN